jgi:branched-chain amino acid aminotransferase
LPKAKLTRFIARANEVRHTMPRNVNEAILVNPQNELLEGLSSNFFAVKAGQLYTADEGVLAGVTRAFAIQAAESLKIPVNYSPIKMSEIVIIDEAFITSSSRGILPLRKIDQRVIGISTPGPRTRSLMAAFEALISERIQEI